LEPADCSNNWTFAGSDAGGRRAAAIYTLIETAKLNDVDPQTWLIDVLARLQDHPAAANERSGYSTSCDVHGSPADRAREHLGATPKRCRSGRAVGLGG